MINRDGVPLSSTDLTRAANRAAILWLEPYVGVLHEELLLEDIIGMDESWAQVLKEEGRNPWTQSYMWQEQTGRYAKHQIILFFYFKTRKYANAKEILKGYKGYIICDGYGAYHDLPPEMIPVGCWAHALAKFEKAMQIMEVNQRSGSLAEKGLNYISQVFRNEADFDEEGLPPEKRLDERERRSRPVTNGLFEWAARTLEEQPELVSSESYLAKALRYILNQREYLENIYLDGRLEISINRSERAFAHYAVCRRAYLFSDTVDGAIANAIYFSIMLTAKANGLHGRKFLKYLLDELPHAKTSELRNYLPWSDTLPEWVRLPEDQRVRIPGSVA
jgi:hypothetical protein